MRMLPDNSVPFHVEHAYTRRETGNYGGSDHIVVEQEVHVGRLHRWSGDALCKPGHKFWGLARVEADRRATCRRCIDIAERIGL